VPFQTSEKPRKEATEGTESYSRKKMGHVFAVPTEESQTTLRKNAIKPDPVFEGKLSELEIHRRAYQERRKLWNEAAQRPNYGEMEDVRDFMKMEGIACKKYNHSLDKEVQRLSC
jgi:hypothetical protein